MKYIVFLLLLLSLISCQQSTLNNPALDIVKASIEAHGGLEHWKSIQTIQFRKKTTLYKDDNSIEKESDEIHTIHQRDTLYGEITPFDKNDKSYQINFANGVGKKILQDTILDGTNAFLASHFVVNQPFKLLDPGVKLTYLGIDTLEGKEPVDVVKAEYGSDDDDIWWFYFDQENSVVLATLIYHAPTYAFVANESIESVDGLLWNTKRTTYRTDSLRNTEYIRAKFEYSEINCF